MVDLRALSEALQACPDLRCVTLMLHQSRSRQTLSSDIIANDPRELLSQLSSLPRLNELILIPGPIRERQERQVTRLREPFVFRDLCSISFRGYDHHLLESVLNSVAVVRSGPVLHDFQRTVDRTDVCRGRTEPDQDRTVKDRSWTVRTGPNHMRRKRQFHAEDLACCAQHAEGVLGA